MRFIVLSAALFLSNLLSAQATNEAGDKFLALFKSQIKKFDIGKIEEHYEEGFFKVLAESEYFDKGVEVGLSSIYQRSYGKDENAVKQEINGFFERNKELKKQRAVISAKMNDFNFMKSFLKIRIYSDALTTQYEASGIVRKTDKGFIEVIVLDLPSGIGSLEKNYLTTWQKSEAEIYLLAKENTLKSLDQNFAKMPADKDGREFYLLSSDTDLFVTSFILELDRTDVPVGKYGTLISAPNNMMLIALPLDDSLKIKDFSLSFMGVTSGIYESNDSKPISSKLFWYNGKELFVIEKNIEKEEFIYPDELNKLIGK